ncbi:MAG: TatD family hydrolase [Burkholderiales bacterium]
MFVDSHCHINFPELAANLNAVMAAMAHNQVSHALCVSVNLETLPAVLRIADQYQNVLASVGVHPDDVGGTEPTVETLVEFAKHPKVVAIGETGLDYFRLKGELDWQRDRFRRHIQAAKLANKPLIIHTREAASDTLRIMHEEGASDIGGVMHCFTETREVARAALDMNFLISFSGIVTFKKAENLREVAASIPLDRLLLETDSPYLAPVPHRGKTNQPAFVRHVAEEIAKVRRIPVEELGRITSENFFRVFGQSGISENRP